jgi:cytochrome c-type biogenesis protein CcmH
MLPSIRNALVLIVPSPFVGEGQGGGDRRTSAVWAPPTPNPSPQEGGGSRVVGRAVSAALLALFLAFSPALAVQPDEVLKDPALEARARSLSQELRCLVCQNQSIDDSNAELARDLRVLVRERLAAGDTDAQVLAFAESRYGQFVLLRPRVKPQTLLLWLTPLLLLAGTGYFLYRARSRASAPQPASLSAAEQKLLDELLKRNS